MPEGHLLHHHAAEQCGRLAGATIASTSPQGRFAEGAAAVHGRVLRDVEAFGKHLLYGFDDLWVHVHLGMRGLFLTYDDPAVPARPGCRWRIAAADGPAYDLIAPSACEVLDEAGRARLLGSLGPDPLRGDADPDEAVRRLRSARGPVGAALLDQSVWAGPGNVYRAEVLFLCGTSPRAPAAALPLEAARRLWDEMATRMADGVRVGSIITTGASPDDPDDTWRWVYKQPVCRRCGAPVEVFDLPRGRTCYACPVDQAA